MKLLSSFIFVHVKMFIFYFSFAAVAAFIASTIIKMQDAGVPLTLFLPFSQFFK